MLAPLAMLTITPEASLVAAPPPRFDPARRFPYFESLFDNSIVKVSLEQESAAADRLFSIVAKASNLSIDEDTVSSSTPPSSCWATSSCKRVPNLVRVK
jgi:hypothetical protein